MAERRTWSIGALLGLLVLAAVGSAAAADVAGLTRLDGSELGASDIPENAILVFYAGWSPRCRGIVEQVNAIHGKWNGTARVFLVNFQEDRAEVEAFLKGKGLKADVLMDRRAVFSKANSITSLPGLLAIKDGTAAFRGKLPSDVTSVLRPIYE